MKHRGTLLALIGLALTLAVTAANAQTYTVLHTYPIGSGAYSGVTFPQVMSLGRDGNLYGTISNSGAKAVGSVFKITTSGAFTRRLDLRGDGRRADPGHGRWREVVAQDRIVRAAGGGRARVHLRHRRAAVTARFQPGLRDAARAG